MTEMATKNTLAEVNRGQCASCFFPKKARSFVSIPPVSCEAETPAW